jgi:hypothetical protein
MTSVQSPDPVAVSPLGEASPSLAAATEPNSVAASDVTYAYALLEMIEIMHYQPDVETMLSAVADYGTKIISADGIAIIHRTSGRWRPVIIRDVVDEPDVTEIHQVVELLVADSWLQQGKRATTSARTSDGVLCLFPASCKRGGRFSSCPQYLAMIMRPP